MLKIAICEDDINDANHLKDKIEKYFKARERGYYIKIYHNAQGLLSSAETYDVLFLDIELPDISGIELASIIREQDEVVSIIYLTNYSDLHRLVLPVHPFAYLIKPISEEKLSKTMDDLEKYNKKIGKNNDIFYIYFKCSPEIVRLRVDKISYFEYLSKKVKVVTDEGDFYIKYSMHDVFQEVEQYDFAFLHRAFIVNMRRIHSVLSKDVKMDNGTLIPIAQRRCSAFKGQFNDFLQRLNNKRGTL